jgi:glutathione S-transferase
MKLYGHPLSGSARKVQMLCEELSIPYTYITVDLMQGEQFSPEFLAVNPNGKVPAIDDDGFTLWESHAILRYLADKNQAASWYPTELKARAKVEAWLDWNHTRLGLEAGRLAFHTLFAGEHRNQHTIDDAHKWLAKILPILDHALGKQDYICGSQITLADLGNLPSMAYLDMCQYDFSSHAAISAWYDRIKQRPSFAATSPK